jgi:cytochrome c-type biogenesis protein CcmH/NrfG
MKAETIVVATASAFFGLLVGWMLGTQYAVVNRGAAPAAASPAAAAAPAAAPAAKTIDENQAMALRATAQQQPSDVRSRVDLGNLYFDGERYQEAAKWYDEALKLAPKDVNVSTDLAVSYYYTSQPDLALKQFDYSLSIDPRHAKTLLNQGVVRAYGKQDLQGAMASWQKVLELAPDSEEAKAAQRMLDGLKAAHPEVTGTAPPPAKRGM